MKKILLYRIDAASLSKSLSLLSLGLLQLILAPGILKGMVQLNGAVLIQWVVMSLSVPVLVYILSFISTKIFNWLTKKTGPVIVYIESDTTQSPTK